MQIENVNKIAEKRILYKLMYFWIFQYLGKFGIFAAFLHILCVAIRLARFNVQALTVEKRYFQGVSSPLGAVTLASFICFNNCREYHDGFKSSIPQL